MHHKIDNRTKATRITPVGKAVGWVLSGFLLAWLLIACLMVTIWLARAVQGML